MSDFKKTKTSRLRRYYFLYIQVAMILIDNDGWLQDVEAIEIELKNRGEFNFTFEEEQAYRESVQKAAWEIKEEYEPSLILNEQGYPCGRFAKPSEKVIYGIKELTINN